MNTREHYSGDEGGILFSTMAVYGKIMDFEPDKESISAYLERVHLFFDANDVADDKKVAVLLSVLVLAVEEFVGPRKS
mgnify:CR=1 FL=1